MISSRANQDTVVTRPNRMPLFIESSGASATFSATLHDLHTRGRLDRLECDLLIRHYLHGVQEAVNNATGQVAPAPREVGETTSLRQRGLGSSHVTDSIVDHSNRQQGVAGVASGSEQTPNARLVKPIIGAPFTSSTAQTDNLSTTTSCRPPHQSLQSTLNPTSKEFKPSTVDQPAGPTKAPASPEASNKKVNSSDPIETPAAVYTIIETSAMTLPAPSKLHGLTFTRGCLQNTTNGWIFKCLTDFSKLTKLIFAKKDDIQFRSMSLCEPPVPRVCGQYAARSEPRTIFMIDNPDGVTFGDVLDALFKAFQPKAQMEGWHLHDACHFSGYSLACIKHMEAAASAGLAQPQIEWF